MRLTVFIMGRLQSSTQYSQNKTTMPRFAEMPLFLRRVCIYSGLIVRLFQMLSISVCESPDCLHAAVRAFNVDRKCMKSTLNKLQRLVVYYGVDLDKTHEYQMIRRLCVYL